MIQINPVDGVLERVNAWLEGAEGFKAGLGLLEQALGLLMGVLSFLGPIGIVLFLVSLLLLGFLGSFSPLPKLFNYVLIVGLITGLSLLGVGSQEEFAATGGAIFRYLIVMLSPVVVVYGLRALFRNRSGGPRQLREAVTELTEQVAQLRRERQGERDRARGETLTVEAASPAALPVLKRLEEPEATPLTGAAPSESTSR